MMARKKIAAGTVWHYSTEHGSDAPYIGHTRPMLGLSRWIAARISSSPCVLATTRGPVFGFVGTASLNQHTPGSASTAS